MTVREPLPAAIRYCKRQQEIALEHRARRRCELVAMGFQSDHDAAIAMRWTPWSVEDKISFVTLTHAEIGVVLRINR